MRSFGNRPRLETIPKTWFSRQLGRRLDPGPCRVRAVHRNARQLLLLSAISAVSPCLVVSVASAATVPVVRCQTEFGVSGPAPSTPSRLSVAGSTHGLVAYTNTASYLLAPSGMRCSGIVAVDGGSQVVVWPQGHGPPALHSHTAGLTLMLEPACVSCKATDACPFFPSLARQLDFPCTGGIPTHEHVYRPRPNLAYFEDFPGTAGSGWPSGGPDPANGVVGYTGDGLNGSVFRSTCTLSARQHSICVESLNDVIRRYG